MATWTKHPSSHRGESRRCRWYSSRALALGIMPRVETKPQTTLQYFRSPAHAVEVFSTYFGPTYRAFNVVEPGQRDHLRKDLEGVFAKWNRAKDGTLVVESNYLRTIAVRK